MPLEAPESGFVWLHVPRRESVEVVVISDVHTWHAHFVRVPGLKGCRAARCLRADGGECQLCEEQIGRRARYVFAVRSGDAVRLVELGRVQYPVLAAIYDSGRWLGARLKLTKEWDAANARIAVIPCGREHVSAEVEVDIGDFVAGLGMAEARTFRAPRVTVELPPSKGSRSEQLSSQDRQNGWKNRPT